MDRADLLEALQRDGVVFAETCDSAGLGASVPSCPGWTVADLLWHLGEVHCFWRTIASRRIAVPDEYQEPARPPDEALLDWYRAGFAGLLGTLTDTPPETEVWTWFTDHTLRGIVRRMAHETAVHRWDAELAAGRQAPVEAELASDGIDEFLHEFTGAAAGAAPVGGTVHVHCTDVAGEWLLVPGPGGPDAPDFTVTREHAKGDCALRGRASDVLLTLWRRQSLDSIDVVGDRAVAERFIAHPPLT